MLPVVTLSGLSYFIKYVIKCHIVSYTRTHVYTNKHEYNGCVFRLTTEQRLQFFKIYYQNNGAVRATHRVLGSIFGRLKRRTAFPAEYRRRTE